MYYKDLLVELSQQIGCQPADPSGPVTVDFEDGTQVCLEADEAEGALYLSSPLVTLSKTDPAVGLRLLGAHLFGRATGDAYFGYHEPGNLLLLFRRMLLKDLNLTTLCEAMKTLAANAVQWRDQLLAPQPNPNHEARQMGLVMA